ncbi:hypothetical protein EIP91_003444 [Steccherinum ochraceum]|uniref:Uncharacterized protein n=1 Tax=Steccherinum ochraceum TaxID=92696 RepID=A0A4R0RM49_9APHY|nr:hypothetical protein EIP91_003444 [Steccherinum ochraceum]
MSLFANVLGFSLFGLAVRVGHLGIQKRNLLDSFTGHALSMGAWGFAGYWAYQWDIRASELIAQKTAEIKERRARKAALEGAESS